MEANACAVDPTPSSPTAWPVAAQLIDTLARRDFTGLAACLDAEVRMRAVLPRAVLDLRSAETVTAKFQEWFGGTYGFEVVDASAGAIGSRQYVRWRIRMWPQGRSEQARIVEQHAFLRGIERVTSLDLLCSGFHEEYDGHAHPGGVR